MESPYTIKIITDLDTIGELAAEWHKLAPPTSVEPWKSFNWHWSLAKAIEKTSFLRIYTVRNEGKLAAIAPMVIKQSEQPLKPWRLGFLGEEVLKEPNQLVGSDPDALNVLIDAIVAERVYPVRLSRIPSNHRTVSSIAEKFKNRGWITKIAYMPYPFLELRTNWMRRSLERDLRRARKKARQYGTSHVEMICGDDQAHLQEYLNELLRVEASGWKGRNKTAILSNKNRKQFFWNFASSASNDGTLRLFFLMLDEKAVAVQYGVESANAFWLLNIGYDERYSDCSPGNLLLEESIKYAVQNDLIHYNLLGKEEPWTRRWTTTCKDSFILAAYRLNYHGLKAMLSDILYLYKKRIIGFRRHGDNQPHLNVLFYNTKPATSDDSTFRNSEPSPFF